MVQEIQILLRTSNTKIDILIGSSFTLDIPRMKRKLLCQLDSQQELKQLNTQELITIMLHNFISMQEKINNSQDSVENLPMLSLI